MGTFRRVNESRTGTLARGRDPEPPGVERRPHRGLLAMRGALSAAALGAYSIAGVVGAFLALFPAALRPVPRGRAASGAAPVAPEASREPLAG